MALDKLRKWLCGSAMAVESSFGGNNHGHLGLVMKAALYQTETGSTWTVPVSGGIFPTFTINAMEAEKRQTVAEFIIQEKDIKVAKLTGAPVQPTINGRQRRVLPRTQEQLLPLRPHPTVQPTQPSIHQLWTNGSLTHS